jgi:hypothetical protein
MNSLPMIRVFTDYQPMDLDGSLFILKIDTEDLDRQVQKLEIKVGDKSFLRKSRKTEVRKTLMIARRTE